MSFWSSYSRISGSLTNLMDNLGIPHQQVIDPTLLFEEHEEALKLLMQGLSFRFVREPEILE